MTTSTPTYYTNRVEPQLDSTWLGALSNTVSNIIGGLTPLPGEGEAII